MTRPSGDQKFPRSKAYSIRDSVDVRVREDTGKFEYDLLIKRGADARGVVLHVGGASVVGRRSQARLSGDCLQLPTDWTEPGAEDAFVARFKLDGSGAADLKYSSYLGGNNRDFALGAGV